MLKKRWNKKQQEAIRILGDPEDHRLHYQVAVDIGVAKQTISRWKQDPEFVDAIDRELSRNLRRPRPGVFKAVVREALKGKFPQQKLYFELTGEYVERKQIKDAGIEEALDKMKEALSEEEKEG